jgi:lipoprotein-anchoring transpeptidase ErfK/SrfK
MFHVYAKFTVQDMRGTNPNGTPYFQPKVPWVSYFYQGSAVHGVYWHPLSWFGVNNSSHGCVGLPVDQAQWVFNWAPIGTTVITHA